MVSGTVCIASKTMTKMSTLQAVAPIPAFMAWSMLRLRRGNDAAVVTFEALASPLGFGRVTLTKASEDSRTEMPFVDDVDSPGVLLNVVKPPTTVWF